MKLFRAIFLFFLINLMACNNINTSPEERINPKPLSTAPAVVKPSFPPFTEFETSEVPVTPSEVDLEQFNFELEVNFDGILSWVYLVEPPAHASKRKAGEGLPEYTELKRAPMKYTLKGGQYGVIVFDSITGCRIAKVILLDKNIKLDYKRSEECGTAN